jgi:SAM-dependent methyltransferase
VAAVPSSVRSSEGIPLRSRWVSTCRWRWLPRPDNAQAGARLIGGDAENLPLQAAQFDVVFSTSSLHLWPNRQRALREIDRVMQPNGRLVITDWCDDFLACRLCDAFLHWRDPARPRVVSRDECGALLDENGFRVMSIDRYKISRLWGLMTVVARKTSGS